MPDIMEAQFLRICSLPAMVTKVTDELLIAIFTICRMIPVGHLCLLAEVTANGSGMAKNWYLKFVSPKSAAKFIIKSSLLFLLPNL